RPQAGAVDTSRAAWIDRDRFVRRRCSSSPGLESLAYSAPRGAAQLLDRAPLVGHATSATSATQAPAHLFWHSWPCSINVRIGVSVIKRLSFSSNRHSAAISCKGPAKISLALRHGALNGGSAVGSDAQRLRTSACPSRDSP